ncbi:helix-turn-helix domain-containing protein [Gracilibacillus sp. JCM 18860]|uniref:helix-turn-helix domain-containing protein n=1 Tax=Gracilibacillus sp. JCM 18860 TaxID=1306159 RepID=UPI0006D0AB03
MIRIRLDVMMAERKMSLNELSEKVGITPPANLSILKNEKGKAIRISTLDALCRVLECQPGDLLEYTEDE